MSSPTTNAGSLTKVTDGIYYMSKSQLLESSIDDLVKKDIKCYIAACADAKAPQQIQELFDARGIATATLSPQKTSELKNNVIFKSGSADMTILENGATSGSNIVIGYDDADCRPILALLGILMMKTKCGFLEALARCICACPLDSMEKDFTFRHSELIAVFKFKQEGEDEDNYRCLLKVIKGGPNFTANLDLTASTSTSDSDSLGEGIQKRHGNHAKLLEYLKAVCGV